MTPEARRKQRTNQSAVLTEPEVARIKRNLLDGRQTARQIALAYSVAPETIRKIARGDSWIWVEPAGLDGEQATGPSQEEIAEGARQLLARLDKSGLLPEGHSQESALEKMLSQANTKSPADQQLDELLTKDKP